MKLLSTKQLSDFIQRTEPAIRNLVMRRKIPFRKVGGRLMFIQSEIEKWVLDSPGVRLEEV